MFTDNVKARGRGRPPGRTSQGEAARRRLYETAIDLIEHRGYEATTLRDVADRAGVSVGLLYRYFPSKRALVLALYDELSADYAQQAASMPNGTWRERSLFALGTSLRVLGPHRTVLSALTPVMLTRSDEGIFAKSTAFSRRRVQATFVQAVSGATDAPAGQLGAALAHLLYLGHLGVILWWLLDKSPDQRATRSLLALLRHVAPSAALTLRLPPIRRFVQSLDVLAREALIDEARHETID
jgi:AcrR family transcriptional regulator